jgi:hypothetical protein
MEEAGERKERDWARELNWQDAEPSGVSTPPTTPLLPVCATRWCIMLKTTRHISITREGEGAGQQCRAHLSTAVAKLRRVFNFHLLFYYMAEESSSTFNPRARCLLQLQSSSPTSSLFNFNPPCQLHPSSPTSTLVAANFNPRRLSNWGDREVDEAAEPR